MWNVIKEFKCVVLKSMDIMKKEGGEGKLWAE